MDLRVSTGRALPVCVSALLAQLGCIGGDVTTIADPLRTPPPSRPAQELVELEPSPPIAERDLSL